MRALCHQGGRYDGVGRGGGRVLSLLWLWVLVRGGCAVEGRQASVRSDRRQTTEQLPLPPASVAHHLFHSSNDGASPELATRLEHNLARRAAATEWQRQGKPTTAQLRSNASGGAPRHNPPDLISPHEHLQALPMLTPPTGDDVTGKDAVEKVRTGRVAVRVTGNDTERGGQRESAKTLPKKPAVVFARHKEDMSWVKRVVKATHGAFRVYVYQSGFPKQPNYVPNAGFESTKYLKFILDHYDALPPKVLFLHAHDKAGHNPCSAASFLPRWHWGTASGYVALPATMKTFPYTGFSDWDTIKWTDLLRWGQELAGLPPRPYSPDRPLKLPMNAQFMVSRGRILQHPRKVYERLYAAGTRAPCAPPDWMKARNPRRPFLARGCDMNRLFGVAMEISWAAILSADQPSIRWKHGRQAGCFSVCKNKDGVYCQPPRNASLSPRAHRPLS